MTRLPILDHATYERALRMASASRAGAPLAREPAPGADLRPAGARMEDRFGRRITYLRLSVTDRCNLRCEYCAPPGAAAHALREDLMLDDEILEILSVMARRGLEKVRFTGGEPLVRPGFVDLVRRARRIPGLRELCLSTNGVLLEEQSADLFDAGIRRFNVSVDTLDPERFRAVTRGGDLARVLRGIEAVLSLPSAVEVKLNAVLMRGVNDDQVAAFAALAREKPLSVRFIEHMPLAHCGETHDRRYLPGSFVLDELRRAGPLGAVPRGPNDGPAIVYRQAGARGTVGVISPVSEEHFCDRCNRVRLSSDGRLKLCLFGDEAADLRAVLRGERRAGDLDAALDEAIDRKPEKMAGFSGFTMMSIGG